MLPLCFSISTFILFRSSFLYEDGLNFGDFPKMRPEVVICDFSYHITCVMLHTCFQCVLLNEAVLSSHSLRYSRIIVHFYVRSNVTGLHFGAETSQKSCFVEFSALKTVSIGPNVVYLYCTH
jgi:hypothetical protein